ncbi:hypothetical protein GCM10011325_00900 [Dyadobacter sediminis]|nr:hypothetical protein GCM10011325_00900 [Dyadobacter sediminis]
MYIKGGFVIGSKKTEPCCKNAMSGEIRTIAVSDKVSVNAILAVAADFSFGTATIVSRSTWTTFTYFITGGSAGL